jgi:hypothetical protein
VLIIIDPNKPPRILNQTTGRALLIATDGRCYISRKYDILSSDDWGENWRLDCRVPSTGWKSLAARSAVAARLLRYYISAFQVLEDGSRVAVARDGLYRAEPGEEYMTRVFTITRGSRPLNLTVDGSRLIFGEYGSDLESTEVFIYVSEDRGKTWHVGYRFPTGDIRHVHNIIPDPWENNYWITVGDYGRQSGIGILSKDLQKIDWIKRGEHECRAVGVIVEKDCILYGTDSNSSNNFIIRLDKQTAKYTKLQEIEGSSLYAARFGPVYGISTCVEPNPACPSRECSLYISRDGDAWRRIQPHKKDWYHVILFQFGALILPFACNAQPKGMFSGQAVVGAHDCVTLINFDDNEVF